MRPGSRSDDFRTLCDTSPQPVVVDDFGGICDTVLVSTAQVPLATAQRNTAASLLGAGARCYWKNSAVFQVIFGFNGAITVNQAPPAALRLRPGVVFAYGAPSYATDGEILVETPATPWPIPYSAETVEPQPYADSPKIYLQGPTAVGFCDMLVIIAHIPWESLE